MLVYCLEISGATESPPFDFFFEKIKSWTKIALHSLTLSSAKESGATVI